MVVPCPPMYFVNECTTMSAPCSIGLNKYGDGTVLSTISGILCLCATRAISGISTTLAAGFPIDSQKIAFVFLSINFSRLGISL